MFAKLCLSTVFATSIASLVSAATVVQNFAFGTDTASVRYVLGDPFGQIDTQTSFLNGDAFDTSLGNLTSVRIETYNTAVMTVFLGNGQPGAYLGGAQARSSVVMRNAQTSIRTLDSRSVEGLVRCETTRPVITLPCPTFETWAISSNQSDVFSAADWYAFAGGKDQPISFEHELFAMDLGVAGAEPRLDVFVRNEATRVRLTYTYDPAPPPTPVPLPSGLPLGLTAFGILGWFARRKYI